MWLRLTRRGSGCESLGADLGVSRWVQILVWVWVIRFGVQRERGEASSVHPTMPKTTLIKWSDQRWGGVLVGVGTIYKRSLEGSYTSWSNDRPQAHAVRPCAANASSMISLKTSRSDWEEGNGSRKAGGRRRVGRRSSRGREDSRCLRLFSHASTCTRRLLPR